MKKIIAVCLPILVLTFVGCGIDIRSGNGPSITGSGKIVTQERTVDTFSKVDFRGAGKLNISQGKISSLTVSVDDNLQEVISTTVSGDTLTIKPSQSLRNFNLTIDLVVSDLKELKVSGVGNAILNNVQCDELSLQLSGAAKIAGSGESRKLTIEMSGAGKMDLADFKSKSVEVNTSGAGSCTVHASESFEGHVSGVGKITCYGGPSKVSKNVSGIGAISIVD